MKNYLVNSKNLLKNSSAVVIGLLVDLEVGYLEDLRENLRDGSK